MKKIIKTINIIWLSVTIVFASVIILSSNTVNAEVLWQENFDNQDDWELEQSTTGDTISSWQGEDNIPPNFNFIRIAPSVYDENNQHNSMMINNSNHRGASGKGLTFWVESGDQSCGSGAHWCSDSLLGVAFPLEGYDEIWIKLYMRFDPTWEMRVTRNTFPMHKMIRTYYWNGGQAPWAYFGNDEWWSPSVIYDLMRMNNGEGNIGWKNIYRFDHITSPPSANPPHVEFEDGYTLDGNYGGTGVAFNFTGNLGDGYWHEMIYRVKLNSAIGLEDGIVQTWFDGTELTSTTDLAFGDIGAPASPRRKWNTIIFGGNDFNEFDPVFENHSEQWWAIDDIIIATTEADLSGGGPSTIRADVDGNSIINTTDASLVLRNYLGLDMTPTRWQASANTGDVNCDGSSNSTDAKLILRRSLGLSMSETGWCAN